MTTYPSCYLCAGDHNLSRFAVSVRSDTTICVPCSERWKLRELAEVQAMAAYAVAPEPRTLESWPPALRWGQS